MQYGQRSTGEGRYRCERCASSDMIDGYHVDRIVDIGDKTELDAALNESPEEVVRVGD